MSPSITGHPAARHLHFWKWVFGFGQARQAAAGGKPLGSSGGWPAYAATLLGLAGLVLGTLYQKRFCAGMDLRSGSFVQMAVAALMATALAGEVEGFAVIAGFALSALAVCACARRPAAGPAQARIGPVTGEQQHASATAPTRLKGF